MILSLRIDKTELFEPHVLVPHNELNEVVYTQVDRFLRKSVPKQLKLNIYSQPMHEALQERVREVYKEHYIDEKLAMKRKLRYVYIRLGILLIVSLTLLYYQFALSREYGNNIVLIVMGNFGAYFLWQIGDTVFDWLEKSRTMKQIDTALKAEIVFYHYAGKKGTVKRGLIPFLFFSRTAGSSGIIAEALSTGKFL